MGSEVLLVIFGKAIRIDSNELTIYEKQQHEINKSIWSQENDVAFNTSLFLSCKQKHVTKIFMDIQIAYLKNYVNCWNEGEIISFFLICKQIILSQEITKNKTIYN